MSFPQENKVFQRPLKTVENKLKPPKCFATTVMNYYDRKIFRMTGSLGLALAALRCEVGSSAESYSPAACV